MSVRCLCCLDRPPNDSEEKYVGGFERKANKKYLTNDIDGSDRPSADWGSQSLSKLHYRQCTQCATHTHTHTHTVCHSDLRESRFSRIFLKFHFSISSHFYFTFTSRSRFPVISISLSFLEKSERETNFTLFLEKKEWNLTPNFIKKILTIRKVSTKALVRN